MTEPVRDAEDVAVWQYHCVMCGAWWEDDADPDHVRRNSICTCEDGGMWDADRIGLWPARTDGDGRSEEAPQELIEEAIRWARNDGSAT